MFDKVWRIVRTCAACGEPLMITPNGDLILGRAEQVQKVDLGAVAVENEREHRTTWFHKDHAPQTHAVQAVQR